MNHRSYFECFCCAAQHQSTQLIKSQSGLVVVLHLEVLAQINLSHGGIVDDLIWLATREDLALADDESAIADAQCFADVVVRNQHADSAAFQKADDTLDLDDGDGVDARERFIQKDKAWIGGEGSRNFHSSAFAT